MALIWDGPAHPDQITAFVRTLPFPGTLQLVPRVNVNPVQGNKVELAEITRKNRVAKFRAWDAGLTTTKRPTVSMTSMNLLPLGSSLSEGEYERLQIVFAQTNGQGTDALLSAVYNDSEILAAEIWNALELALGRLLATGKITIDENGIKQEADFGVPTEQKPTATMYWTNPASQQLDDLRTWTAAAMSNSGVRPSYLYTSDSVVQNMMSCTQWINAAYGSAAGRTMVTLPDLNSALAARALPQIPLNADGTPVTWDSMVSVDEVDTRAFPANKIFLGPRDISSVVEIKSGITGTSLQLVQDRRSNLTFQEAPGMVGAIDGGDSIPYRRNVVVDGCYLPVMNSPKSVVIARVAA